MTFLYSNNRIVGLQTLVDVRLCVQVPPEPVEPALFSDLPRVVIERRKPVQKPA